MRFKNVSLIAAVITVVGFVEISFAALLGNTLDFPKISFDSQGTTAYDAGTDLLTITASPISIRVSAADPPRTVNPTGALSSKVLSIGVTVNATGALVGGVSGDDLKVVGEVDLDGDSIIDFAGVLLTGEVLEFGFLDSGGPTDSYDFRFTVTGGLLAPLYTGKDLGVAVTSESSTFTGNFTVNFNGRAKGTLGAIEPLKASIGDFVWDDLNANGIQDSGEPGIAGVTVNLYTSSNVFVDTTTTASGGIYGFTNLVPGDYFVEFLPPAGFVFSPQDQGGDDTKDSDANPTTGRTASVTLASGENNLTLDAGLFRQASLAGYVYVDANNNGVKEFGEVPIPGATVTLTGTDDLGNSVSLSTTTDASGFYSFTNLRPGTYVITETQPAGYLDGKDTIGTPGGTTGNDVFSNIVLGAGVNGVNNNFGELLPASLAGNVYSDANNDGIFQGTESGIANVLVTLTGTDDLGNPVSLTTTTASDGSYSFGNLRPGTYVITETQPAGYLDGKDTIGTPGGTTGNDVFNNIVLAAGINGVNNNFGELLAASLGDRVWFDLDADGIQDTNETDGVQGVTVNLYDGMGGFVTSTTTNASGIYSFTNLTPGTYSVEFVVSTLPTGFVFSPQGLGGNDALDSDADTTTGRTALITLASGATDLTWDAGLRTAPGGGNLVCDLKVDMTCMVAAPSTEDLECKEKIAATLLRYIGSVNILNATVVFSGKDSGVATYTNVNLIPGVTVLSAPSQNGFTIDARPSDLGAKMTISVNGVVQEVIHTSCSTPYIAGKPAPLDGNSPGNPIKGTPSPNWFVESYVEKNGRVVSAQPPVVSDNCTIQPGNSVTYGYKVTNDGDALTDVTVVDDRLGQIAGPFNLASGQTLNFTKTVAVINTTISQVTVTGKLANNTLCTASDTTTVTVEAPPADCCKDGKPKVLTMQYTGQDCTFTSHSQAASKVTCTDYLPLPNTVYIVVNDKDNPTDTGGKVWFSGSVTLNGTFNIDATKTGDSKLASDTRVHIFTQQGGNLVQFVKFHTSCSQPLFVGNQFGSAKLIDCIGESAPQPPGGDDCCKDGKPKVLTMQYTGQDCTFTSHSQAAGKVTCTDFAPLLNTVYIVANDNDNPSSGKIWFSGTVSLNGTFNIDATKAGDTRLSTDTRVHIFTQQGGTKLQFVTFHTSCSQPLFVGNQFGSAKITNCIGENTPTLGDCCKDGKPKVLTMQYTGQDCTQTSHSQAAGKVACTDYAPLTSTVYIVVNDKDNPSKTSGKVWFSGTVTVNGTFDIDATKTGDTKLKSDTYVHIFNQQGGNLLQFVKFHTSCSQPLFIGDRFGSAKITNCISEKSPNAAPPALSTVQIPELQIPQIAIPQETRALANFPNPFNPETWIAYELAEDVNVSIQIYDVTGRRVRTLDLGQRAAGYYVDRAKAAYWDGRNDTGERVASGVYLYRLTAGNYAAMRRMLILK
ncbi:carboxypeptidase regulatory-like domain-containing protein [Candidatus Poribacteria bacterium]|nr:carboxypeptidase regulatory-like domain-containing protein [Candidatus Poribacteria bacterium]